MTAGAVGSAAQTPSASPSGLEFSGIPVLNFDSDEGVGYGAIAELYSYGELGRTPYEWTLQPRLILATEGRRELTAFFDAPHVLPPGWRMDFFTGIERHIATPYYGVGNASVYDESLDDDDGPNPFFYRFGRTRRSLTFNLQREVSEVGLRVLFGGGLERTDVDAVPKDDGTTLYEQELGLGVEGFWTNYIRAGVIWDTRNQETGPTSGAWSEFLVQWVDESLSADTEFFRWTVTDRRYFSISPTLVFAHRVLVQNVSDDAPVHELFRVQTSFRQQEGLGGSKTVRGVLKNRYVGAGLFVWNAELRWRAAHFRFLGRPGHLVLSAFLDQGRVWADGIDFDEVLSDLHRGFGGGVRVGLGQNFVVAFDGGTSADVGAQVYIGLGYLY